TDAVFVGYSISRACVKYVRPVAVRRGADCVLMALRFDMAVERDVHAIFPTLPSRWSGCASGTAGSWPGTCHGGRAQLPVITSLLPGSVAAIQRRHDQLRTR